MYSDHTYLSRFCLYLELYRWNCVYRICAVFFFISPFLSKIHFTRDAIVWGAIETASRLFFSSLFLFQKVNCSGQKCKKALWQRAGRSYYFGKMFTWKHHWGGLRNDCHHISCLVGWYSSFNRASGKDSVIIYLYTNHPLKFPGKDYLKYIQGDFSLKWIKRSQVTYLLIVLIMKQETSGLVRLCKSRFVWKGFELHQEK